MMSRPRRLAGQAVPPLDLAKHQRTDAVGVAEADHRVAGEQHRAEGAAQPGDDVPQGAPDVVGWVLGEQGRDDLGVGRALEDVPALHEAGAQFVGVDQVAVVSQGDEGAVPGAGEGLGVPHLAGAGGRVAHVPDGQLPGKCLQDGLLEHLGHQPHVLVDDQARTVGDRYAGRFLTAVLQGEEGEEGQAGDIHLRGVDGEHPAFIMG